MTDTVLFWRRTGLDGLERLTLSMRDDGVVAQSTVLCAEDGGFRLDHAWRLDRDWRAQSVIVERWGAQGHGRLMLERSGGGWRVNGDLRPDLDGAEEPDLSVTPFCNTFAIRRLLRERGATLTLDTAFIDGAALTVARSRQRYLRQARDRVRYIDLGLSAGFEADLTLGEHDLVLDYEHLFARVRPA